MSTDGLTGFRRRTYRSTGTRTVDRDQPTEGAYIRRRNRARIGTLFGVANVGFRVFQSVLFRFCILNGLRRGKFEKRANRSHRFVEDRCQLSPPFLPSLAPYAVPVSGRSETVNFKLHPCIAEIKTGVGGTSLGRCWSSRNNSVTTPRYFLTWSLTITLELPRSAVLRVVDRS